MRVLINAASAHMGGAVTYLQNVLRQLPAEAPNDVFVVYVPEATAEKLPLGLPNVEVRSYPFTRTSGLPRLWFDQVVVPGLLRRERADVLFSSTGFGTVVSPAHQLLLVRNIAYFDPLFHTRYRQLGRSLLKNTIRRWHSYVSMGAADAVLFPTHAMKELVAESAPLSAEAFQALHYGFDHDRFAAANETAFARSDEVARWRAEGYRVLLNVSTFAVQKNYETLVEAMGLLRRRGVRIKLLTTIARKDTTDTAEYDALWRRAAELGVADDIVELGYVPYQQLGSLYAQADAYIFPSFSESFGHSMVEAMASGLPVVTADTGVNREVCADAALYFSPFDAEACAGVLEDVLGSSAVRARLQTASLERARQFSWASYVHELVLLLRNLAGEDKNAGSYVSTTVPPLPSEVV